MATDKHYFLAIIVMVTVVDDKYKEQLKACIRTWYQDTRRYNIKVCFFGGYLPFDECEDYVSLPSVQEDYQSATDKHYYGLEWMYDNYTADYYMIFGTDTFIHIPNLVTFLKKQDKTKPLYIGGTGKWPRSDFSRYLSGHWVYFHSGGSGIILTRSAAAILVARIPLVYSDWYRVCKLTSQFNWLYPACDVSTAYYLEGTGVQEVRDLMFETGYHEMQNLDSIFSCHHMSPERMDWYHSYIHKKTPTSIDSPIELSNYYFTTKDYIRCIQYSRRILAINRKSYPIYLNLALSCYHQGHADECRDLLDKLILTRETPKEIVENAYPKLLLTLNQLPLQECIQVNFSTPVTICNDTSKQKPHNILNPSIVRLIDGYRVLCRLVNYVQDRGYYTIYDDNGIIRSKCYLVDYTFDFEMKACREVLEDPAIERKRYQDRNFKGFEDGRLLCHQDTYYFTATTFDSNEKEISDIALCHLDTLPLTVHESNDNLLIKEVVILKAPQQHRCEKNWSPFTLPNGNLGAIYHYEPLTIYDFPNIHQGDHLNFSSYQHELNLGRLKGSAGPLPFTLNDKDGYLVIIHETIQTDRFFYIHRFLWFNSSFQLTHMSHLFHFGHVGVEFCSGVCYHHNNNEVIIGFGREDREAFLGRTDCNVIRSMLDPISDLTLDFNKRIDKIYCINLDTRPDRWSQLQRRISKWPSIKVERLRASCPADPEIKDVPAYQSQPKIYGCAMSHMRIWRQIVAKKYARTLILEDDALFHNDWIRITHEKLDLIDTEDPQWDSVVLNYGGTLPQENVWQQISYRDATGAYILSLKGAEWLVKTFDNGSLMASDSMTGRLHDCGHSYAYFPWLATQECIDSDVQGKSHQESDRKIFLESIKKFAHLYSY